MDVRIIDLPKAHVAYQRLIGPYGPAIGQFWRGTIAPWMHSNGRHLTAKVERLQRVVDSTS